MPSHSSNPVPVPAPAPVEEQPSNPTVLQTPIAVRVAEPVAAIRTKFVAKIPQHIFKIYLEKAIHSEETCPITLEKFTLENVACTPCGHLFDRDAIKMNLERSPLCPTCRTKIRANELQTL
jgi:predicted Zn-ribbon and HTH transcriptional regulator